MNFEKKKRKILIVVLELLKDIGKVYKYQRGEGIIV